jgi:toxin-antitoxin system PIN domain toxin
MPSTPIEALLDVNVVIASVFADHTMHTTARSFVEGLERFRTTPMTQGGFLRFATRPWKNERKEEQPPRLTMAEALAKLREFTAARGHAFLPDDVSFTEVGLRSMQGHRQWTDAYLLHLARVHGLALVSLESRMANLEDPAKPVLFVVKPVGQTS